MAYMGVTTAMLTATVKPTASSKLAKGYLHHGVATTPSPCTWIRLSRSNSPSGHSILRNCSTTKVIAAKLIAAAMQMANHLIPTRAPSCEVRPRRAPLWQLLPEAVRKTYMFIAGKPALVMGA